MGSIVTVYYDPSDPGEAILDRSLDNTLVILIVFGSLVGIIMLGFSYFGFIRGF